MSKHFPEPSELIKPYRVASDQFTLSNFDPSDTQGFHLKEQAPELLSKQIAILGDLQRKLYLQRQWALLLIVQGMDSSGKDSVIRNVLSGVNVEGCEVYSFKVPSDDELSHDFMWRYARCTPKRGRIGIFNRSYYEDVLSVRVHKAVLRRQRIPHSLMTEALWRERFEYFNAFETYLSRNGIVPCKVYLNLSKEEQKRRFLRRLHTPEKQWKYSAEDLRDRQDWDQFLFANEEMMRHTATPLAPWYIVPADHKWFTRLVVVSVLIEALRAMELSWPEPSEEQKNQIEAGIRALKEEK